MTRVWVSLFGILVVLAAALVWWMSAFHIDFRYVAVLLTAPKEVKAMLFVTHTDDVSGLSEIRYGGIKTRIFDRKKILQISRSQQDTIALMQEIGSEAIDVFWIKGNQLIPLTRDGFPKASISVSPNGNLVAYAINTAPSETTPPADERLALYDVGVFETVVINRADGSEMRVPGNHPHFLDDTLLFVMDRKGLTIHELDTGSFRYIADDLASFVVDAPAYADPGIFIVTNPITGDFMAFGLTPYESYNPVFPQLIAIFPASEGDFALARDTSLFLGDSTGGAFTIKELDRFQSPGRTIFSLPSSYFNPSRAFF